MKIDTINILQEIIKGKFYMLTKSDSDEVFEVLQMLENYNVLRINLSNGFVINGIKNIYKIEKLIQFNNTSQFNNWISNEIKEASAIFTFNDAQIGQINHKSNLNKSKNNFSFNSFNKKNIEKKSFWKLISNNPLISTFISGILIIIFCYIVKIYFGIELKQ